MTNYLYDIFKHWGNEIYCISDTHFSDAESFQFRKDSNSLPEDVTTLEEYNDFIIKSINAKAGRNSCLIILGDVGNLECVKKLRAKRKILIMGNHDKGASNYKREVVTTSQLLCWRLEFKGINPPLCLSKDYSFEQAKNIGLEMGQLKNIVPVYDQADNHLFDEVYEGPLMINDRTILSHEPVFAGVPYFKNLHGHVHKADYKGDDHHLNCCAEAINYEPINLLSLFKKGFLKNIDSIHRMTIDTATARKRRK